MTQMTICKTRITWFHNSLAKTKESRKGFFFVQRTFTPEFYFLRFTFANNFHRQQNQIHAFCKYNFQSLIQYYKTLNMWLTFPVFFIGKFSCFFLDYQNWILEKLFLLSIHQTVDFNQKLMSKTNRNK